MTLMNNSIEAKLNSYATRCFLDTADRDYVHARLAYRSRLTAQFRWSAIHCLEKYGKCILLLNRICGKKIGHEVMESISRLKAAGRFEIKLSDGSLAFIRRLEDGAKHRYLETSWYSLNGDLERLDTAVVEIRRYCRVLDFEIKRSNGEMIKLFDHYLDAITPKEGQPLLNVPLTGGWLESVVGTPDHPAREGLLWDNLYFGSPEKNEKAEWEYSESEISPFELHPEVVEELDKWIFVPKWMKSK